MYFEKFIKERGIKPETIKGYKTTINRYTDYYNMSIDDLINEAINEENDIHLKKRERSIKSRLLQFRTFLATETELKHSTILNHMKNLTTLYSHYDVELPNLPPFKSTDKNETSYFDLPTKKQISMAVETAGIRIGSLILFMASSGTGRTECSNMTIRDFVNACSMYSEKTDLREFLEEVYSLDEEAIPTFYLFRQKTEKSYYTFCSPEATDMIIKWLFLRLDTAENLDEEVSLDDSLWGLTTRQITYHFNNINDELKFGFKGSYRFFRPHTLRKFHASNIGLDKESIDLLQGRSKNAVHETYIKTNPDKFKEIYRNVVENVTMESVVKEIKHEEYNIIINLNFYGENFSVNL